MDLSVKIRVLNSCVLPVLYYGTLGLLIKGQHKKLKTTHYAMLRSILGLKIIGKVRLDEICDRAGVEDLGYIVKKLKFGFAGQQLKMKLFGYIWIPYGTKRGRGRLCTRWRDNLFQLKDSTQARNPIAWTQLANDRGKWMRTADAHARLWEVQVSDGGTLNAIRTCKVNDLYLHRA